jgi:hypothetical protein
MMAILADKETFKVVKEEINRFWVQTKDTVIFDLPCIY